MSGTWGSPNVQPWRDDFKGWQQPRPTPVDDLSRFVLDRIDFTESEPQFDVPQAYNQPAGPIAHRYAAGMRRDMVAFRWIVASYCHAAVPAAIEDRSPRLAGEFDLQGLETAMYVLASRWSDHPDFRDQWRIE